MINRDINLLVPELHDKAQAAIKEMEQDPELKRLGVTGIYICETRRDMAVQMAYYSRGRMKIADVKKMYKAAGLYAIGDNEAKIKNTQTLWSKHIEGKAIDLYPLMHGKVVWSPAKAIWNRMGVIGQKHGLEWGGSWAGWKDCPHFQID